MTYRSMYEARYSKIATGIMCQSTFLHILSISCGSYCERTLLVATPCPSVLLSLSEPVDDSEVEARFKSDILTTVGLQAGGWYKHKRRGDRIAPSYISPDSRKKTLGPNAIIRKSKALESEPEVGAMRQEDSAKCCHSRSCDRDRTLPFRVSKKEPHWNLGTRNLAYFLRIKWAESDRHASPSGLFESPRTPNCQHNSSLLYCTSLYDPSLIYSISREHLFRLSVEI